MRLPEHSQVFMTARQDGVLEVHASSFLSMAACPKKDKPCLKLELQRSSATSAFLWEINPPQVSKLVLHSSPPLRRVAGRGHKSASSFCEPVWETGFRGSLSLLGFVTSL